MPIPKYIPKNPYKHNNRYVHANTVSKLRKHDISNKKTLITNVSIIVNNR